MVTGPFSNSQTFRYSIITDLRSSPAESQNLTISSLTSNLHTLLTGTSSELSQTHLVGLGLGASIALSFLSKCPDSVASFTGISFAVPLTAAARSRQVSDWINRATLAEKLGMRITADKAVSRWFTADQRDLEAWNTVKGMIESGTVSQFQGMVAAMIESLGADGDAEDGKVFRPVAILNRLETRPLFLAGSGDGVMPEDMESYPSLMKSGSGRFEIVRNAGRVFWWDESKMAQISEKFAALIDGNGKS
jgi:pimeloyl-ACP methyl ester carboxylesterase